MAVVHMLLPDMNVPLPQPAATHNATAQSSFVHSDQMHPELQLQNGLACEPSAWTIAMPGDSGGGTRGCGASGGADGGGGHIGGCGGGESGGRHEATNPRLARIAVDRNWSLVGGGITTLYQRSPVGAEVVHRLLPETKTPLDRLDAAHSADAHRALMSSSQEHVATLVNDVHRGRSRLPSAAMATEPGATGGRRGGSGGAGGSGGGDWHPARIS